MEYCKFNLGDKLIYNSSYDIYCIVLLRLCSHNTILIEYKSLQDKWTENKVTMPIEAINKYSKCPNKTELLLYF